MLAVSEELHIEQCQGIWLGQFRAMGSPCEVWVDTDHEPEARALIQMAQREARRIEGKYSRYREDSVVADIHRQRGKSTEVDSETAYILDFAATCFRLSGGRFDITSGVLRQMWHFEGQNRLPDPHALLETLARVGWQKVAWNKPWINLPLGMEIDLGGLGKEYAVDRVAQRIRERTRTPVLINFGGDLYATAPLRAGGGWRVNIEDPEAPGQAIDETWWLNTGAVATSGDTRRCIVLNGVRYGHILDPRTGWPVEGAPRSVTVAASTCLEAGMYTTLAILHGPAAQDFLSVQGIKYKLIA
ncbi:MAG: FAD:protein FMN transferase [Gammaproteobacteria bacterium]|nr:FAD:protein FMN transferase [Gammaproteobacteria bacterium]